MKFILLASLSFSVLNVYGAAIKVNLGAAGSFGVLAGTTVTNTGLSVVNGSIGASPGSAITGFPPGIVTGGAIHAGDAAAQQAGSDLFSAYSFAASQPCGSTLTGQNLGGLTLNPGVYCFTSSAQLSGNLTLDGLGDPNAIFLFQIASTLTTANNSEVLFVNGGKGTDLFWQVGSSATLGLGSSFSGELLALTTITLGAGADNSCGSALANNGAVTLDTNQISINSAACPAAAASNVPEPRSATLFSMGLLAGLIKLGLRSASKKPLS